MGRVEIGFEVTGLDHLRRLRLHLTEEANRTIPRDIDTSVMAGARFLRDVARKKVLAQPTPQNAGHTGMRAEIARGVRVRRVAPGTIRLTTQMSESDEAMLPRGTDMPRKGWRHPVFGNRDVWVRQHGPYSWFIDTMQDGEDNIRERLELVLERAAERIDRVS